MVQDHLDLRAAREEETAREYGRAVVGPDGITRGRVETGHCFTADDFPGLMPSYQQKVLGGAGGRAVGAGSGCLENLVAGCRSAAVSFVIPMLPRSSGTRTCR
jgi:hypothetical protein